MLLSASNEEMSMTNDVCTNKCDDAMLHQIKQRTNVMGEPGTSMRWECKWCNAIFRNAMQIKLWTVEMKWMKSVILPPYLICSKIDEKSLMQCKKVTAVRWEKGIIYFFTAPILFDFRSDHFALRIFAKECRCWTLCELPTSIEPLSF